MWEVSCELRSLWKETFLVYLIELKNPFVLQGVATDVIYYYFKIHILMLFVLNRMFIVRVGRSNCASFSLLVSSNCVWSNKRYFFAGY
jgi:hypothetical protein